LNKASGLGQGNLNKASGLGQGNLNKASGLGQGNLNKASDLGQGNLNKASGLGQGNLNKASGLGQEPRTKVIRTLQLFENTTGQFQIDAGHARLGCLHMPPELIQIHATTLERKANEGFRWCSDIRFRFSTNKSIGLDHPVLIGVVHPSQTSSISELIYLKRPRRI